MKTPDLKARKIRVCAACGSKFSPASENEFYPVCMLYWFFPKSVSPGAEPVPLLCVRHERLPSSAYKRIGIAEFQRFRTIFALSGQAPLSPANRVRPNQSPCYSIRVTLGLILLRISSAGSVFLSPIRYQTAETSSKRHRTFWCT
jgi:hypothetical protein